MPNAACCRYNEDALACLEITTAVHASVLSCVMFFQKQEGADFQSTSSGVTNYRGSVDVKAELGRTRSKVPRSTATGAPSLYEPDGREADSVFASCCTRFGGAYAFLCTLLELSAHGVLRDGCTIKVPDEFRRGVLAACCQSRHVESSHLHLESHVNNR